MQPSDFRAHIATLASQGFPACTSRLTLCSDLPCSLIFASCKFTPPSSRMPQNSVTRLPILLVQQAGYARCFDIISRTFDIHRGFTCVRLLHMSPDDFNRLFSVRSLPHPHRYSSIGAVWSLRLDSDSGGPYLHQLWRFPRRTNPVPSQDHHKPERQFPSLSNPVPSPHRLSLLFTHLSLGVPWLP